MTNYAIAEKTDRNNPINLEADSVVVDDGKKTSTFQGNVSLNQGTLSIKSDKMVVILDQSNQFKFGTAYGSPNKQVLFRQKREGANEYIEGYADRIEYDSKADFVQLIHNARLKRNQDDARGQYISYNAKTEVYKVLGSSNEKSSNNNGNNRVKITIYPKNTDSK